MGDMQVRYWGSFMVVSLLCIVLQFVTRASKSKTTLSSSNVRFQGFQINYLIVFLLAMFSDWLQGPYVYELYVSYGFSQSEIAELFVCGFGSSMVVGTFVGSLADTMGRKSMCIIYSVCYIAACFTKLVPNYWVLMLGRFLSGISTSLLFSVFESWMVCEHFKQGYEGIMLNDTFAYATIGNGLVAVVAGLVANIAASYFGFVAPFVVAILPLALVAVLIFSTWSENYGNQQLSSLSSLWKGFELVRTDSKIAALGLSQSCFEGAMYTFVFMWTPALKTDAELTQGQGEHGHEAAATTSDIESTSQYLGLIFAVFMVCVMVGSSIFKYLSLRKEFLYKIPIILHSVALFSMITITLFFENKFVVYTMFLLFEMCVGMFYPSYGVIKSDKIPEDIRSAVMNIFRIPLNAFVVLLLLKISKMSSMIVFSICALTHGLALLSYLFFYSKVSVNKSEEMEEHVELLNSKDGSV